MAESVTLLAAGGMVYVSFNRLTIVSRKPIIFVDAPKISTDSCARKFRLRVAVQLGTASDRSERSQDAVHDRSSAACDVALAHRPVFPRVFTGDRPWRSLRAGCRMPSVGAIV